MIRLPKWVLTNPRPSVYDSESATAIEMVAKIYQSMNELIDEYNKFADDVNKNIEQFENDTNSDIEHFTVSLRQEFQDFIDVVEMKLQEQDKEIQDAYNYMVANIESTTREVVLREMESGILQVGLSYNGETEDLSLVASTTEIEPTKVHYYEDTESITIM